VTTPAVLAQPQTEPTVGVAGLTQSRPRDTSIGKIQLRLKASALRTVSPGLLEMAPIPLNVCPAILLARPVRTGARKSVSNVTRISNISSQRQAVNVFKVATMATSTSSILTLVSMLCQLVAPVKHHARIVKEMLKCAHPVTRKASILNCIKIKRQKGKLASSSAL